MQIVHHRILGIAVAAACGHPCRIQRTVVVNAPAAGLKHSADQSAAQRQHLSVVHPLPVMVQGLQHRQPHKAVIWRVGRGKHAALRQMRHTGITGQPHALPRRLGNGAVVAAPVQLRRLGKEPPQVIQLPRIGRGIGHYADAVGMVDLQLSRMRRVSRLQYRSTSRGVGKEIVHRRWHSAVLYRYICDPDRPGRAAHLGNIPANGQQRRDQLHTHYAGISVLRPADAGALLQKQQTACQALAVNAVQQPTVLPVVGDTQDRIPCPQGADAYGNICPRRKRYHMCACVPHAGVQVAGAEPVGKSLF